MDVIVKKAIVDLLINAIKVKRISNSIECITGANELSAAFNMLSPILRLMGLNLKDKELQKRIEFTEAWEQFFIASASNGSPKNAAWILYHELDELIKSLSEPENDYEKTINTAVAEFIREDKRGNKGAIHDLNGKYKAANRLFPEAKSRLKRQYV
ncbi:hypothetical protein [Carboxylicivirga marina]|uniref:Uncharacterized protein n=1 Tax=Carboxylicivirga marina TaxID=2800988 RepID=A0ABS1HPV3_9BACT|nr:hypothetical protein [Carboxylicivirga marina]MBK3519713.1 hypothetical protein [Carboxylicivirga marina]